MIKVRIITAALALVSFPVASLAAAYDYAGAVAKKLNGDRRYKLVDRQTEAVQGWPATRIKIMASPWRNMRAFTAISNPDSEGVKMRVDGYVSRNGAVITTSENGVDDLRVAK